MKFDESLQERPPAEILKEIKEKCDKVYALSLASKEAEKKFKEAKNELCKIMEDAKLDKMQGDTCNISCKLKTSSTVPKDQLSKDQLFNYIVEEYGRNVLDTMLTINPKSFNSWYDAEIAKHVKLGNPDFKLKMIKPFEYYSLSVAKRTITKGKKTRKNLHGNERPFSCILRRSAT